MNATPTEFSKDDKEKDSPPAILVCLAIFVIVAAALTFIGVAEALIPGSYGLIVSLSLLAGMFFIGRTVMKNFDTEALAASIAPNVTAAASAASAPRNAEDMAKESTEVDVDDSEVTVADAEEPGASPRTE